MLGGARVEISGGLVGEQDARGVGNRARDRDALLLAPRKLRGAVSEALLQAEVAEQIAGAPGGFPAREPADHLRHDHVLNGGKFHQQVMELIDEADLGSADARALGIRERRGRNLIDIDFAAIGMLEESSDVQERRLAGAGGRYQRNRLARPDGELGAFEDVQRDVALAIVPVDLMQEQDRRRLVAMRNADLRPRLGANRVTHSAAPRPDRGVPRARPDRASPRAIT